VRRAAAAALTIALASPATADVPSVLGGKLVPAGTSAHHVAAGVPGVYYEWWHGGWNADWAMHAGLVYEDWSGAFSDVELGLELEVPTRIRVGGGEKADVAMRLTPGALLADAGQFVLGLRGEGGILVSVDVHPEANFVTGVTAPVTVLLTEGADAQIVVPVLGRIGLESFSSREWALSLLLEVGPAFGVGQVDDRKFAARFWVGVTYYD